MEIRTVDYTLFEFYSDELFTLYNDAFSRGLSAQFIDKDSTLKYIHQILKEGKGILAIDNGKLAGALLLSNLSFDLSLPKIIRDEFPIEKSMYINELMVHEMYRGKGIGKLLMDKSYRYANSKHFQYCFIRVWVENLPAVNLYQSDGFKEIARITQKKQTPDKSAFKVFPKIYMYKNLKEI